MASTSVTSKTIVVADDTAFVRDRFRTALENAGHKAIAVKSAAELLARVRADLGEIGAHPRQQLRRALDGDRLVPGVLERRAEPVAYERGVVGDDDRLARD